MKRKKVIGQYHGTGKICRKCNEPTIIKKRIEPPRNKSFYYTQWEYCRRCQAVYFEEKYKSIHWQEHENQEQHLFDISRET